VHDDNVGLAGATPQFYSVAPYRNRFLQNIVNVSRCLVPDYCHIDKLHTSMRTSNVITRGTYLRAFRVLLDKRWFNRKVLKQEVRRKTGRNIHRENKMELLLV